MNIEAKQKELSDFYKFLKEQGYTDIRMLDIKRYAAIFRFAFTHAIIVGQIGDQCGYEDRWCYSTYDQAKAALDAWNGYGEPDGWHRHPISGRRRNNGDEYINY